MIFIVIDNSSYEKPSVLGVYKQWEEAENYILSQPDIGDDVDVITWDIVRNVEIQ